jgi:hypothetical protein
MSSPSDRTRRLYRTLAPDPDAAIARAAKTTIAITMPQPSPADEIALALCLTLLCRLDDAAPQVLVDIPTTRATPLPRLADGDLLEALLTDHHRFASAERIRRGRTADADLALSFGGTSSTTVSTSGWAISLGSPLPRDTSGNPIAAAFAGAQASAEVFKAQLQVAGLDIAKLRPWRGVCSLWDYQLAPAPGPPLPDLVDLTGTAFVGCGGIASATAWTLALLRLVGRPWAVDRDDLDITNLNRHLTGSHPQLKTNKAELLAAMLRQAGADATAIHRRWQEIAAADRPRLELGVISVDDDPARRDFQFDLPRLILNAGNADSGLWQVTRHPFDTGACLACIARGDQRSSGPEESAAAQMGLRFADVKPHLDADAPLPPDLLEQAALPEALRAQLAGIPARRALGLVCGKHDLGTDAPAPSVPMLSALPGIVLAAETVKHTMAASSPLDTAHNVVAANLLRGPHARWLQHRAKQPGCKCTDPLYQRVYEDRWPH